MAGRGFDPLDIRSELGASLGVASPPTTPHDDTDPSLSMQLVPVEYPTPLAEIAPGEPGNEIDVDNPPDFEALNRNLPQVPLPRRSKRQAGFDPEFIPTKKPKASTSTNLLDPDFSSDVDSGDDDYELVARPKTSAAAKKTAASTSTKTKSSAATSSRTMTDIEEEDEQSLAEFLAKLKEEKAARKSGSGDESPDTEMMEEFEANRPSDSSDGSSSKSTSEDYGGTEDVASESTKGEQDISEDDVSGGEAGVAAGVDNTADNTDYAAYDLPTAFATRYYSEHAVSLWPIFVNRGFIEEVNIDVEAFEKQNLITFFKTGNMLSTVLDIEAYCRRPVLEFYTNLLSSVGDANSPKYGRVFVRDKLYDFTPSVINNLFDSPAGMSDASDSDIDMICTVVTGGLVRTFPAIPKRLSAASLTSFYSVLHKIAVKNWTPSSNTTIVTRAQALVLFAVGTGSASFNLGETVFATVLQFAEGNFKSSKLPYPSLIYKVLKSQGFDPDIDDDIVAVGEPFKIAAAYFKGNRKVDLPWSGHGVGHGVDNTASTSTAKPSAFPSTDYVMVTTAEIQSQINFGRRQIANAQSVIAFYEEQIAQYELLLDVGVFSGQKGGDEQGGSEAAGHREEEQGKQGTDVGGDEEE